MIDTPISFSNSVNLLTNSGDKEPIDKMNF